MRPNASASGKCVPVLIFSAVNSFRCGWRWRTFLHSSSRCFRAETHSFSNSSCTRCFLSRICSFFDLRAFSASFLFLAPASLESLNRLILAWIPASSTFRSFWRFSKPAFRELSLDLVLIKSSLPSSFFWISLWILSDSSRSASPNTYFTIEIKTGRSLISRSSLSLLFARSEIAFSICLTWSSTLRISLLSDCRSFCKPTSLSCSAASSALSAESLTALRFPTVLSQSCSDCFSSVWSWR